MVVEEEVEAGEEEEAVEVEVIQIVLYLIFLYIILCGDIIICVRERRRRWRCEAIEHRRQIQLAESYKHLDCGRQGGRRRHSRSQLRFGCQEEEPPICAGSQLRSASVQINNIYVYCTSFFLFFFIFFSEGEGAEEATDRIR